MPPPPLPQPLCASSLRALTLPHRDPLPSLGGYLNLGLKASAGLPSPITGVLAPSYKLAAPKAKAKATGNAPRPMQASVFAVPA